MHCVWRSICIPECVRLNQSSFVYLTLKKTCGHQTTIYINPPNPPHCSIFVAHLTSGWKSLIDLRFHASTSTVSPLDCTLVHTWPHPGTSTWRWHLVSGGCGTCVWHLLVELACGTCLWYLLVCQNCGTWHHHHLVVAPGRGPLLNWRSSWCLQLPPGTKLPPDRRSTPRWWSRTPLTPPINSSDLISR